MTISHLQDLFKTLAISQALPVLLDKESKSIEANQIKMLSNQMVLNYLEATTVEKRELLNMIKTANQEVLDLLNNCQNKVEIELLNLKEPLANA